MRLFTGATNKILFRSRSNAYLHEEHFSFHVLFCVLLQPNISNSFSVDISNRFDVFEIPALRANLRRERKREKKRKRVFVQEHLRTDRTSSGVERRDLSRILITIPPGDLSRPAIRLIPPPRDDASGCLVLQEGYTAGCVRRAEIKKAHFPYTRRARKFPERKKKTKV